MRVSSVRLQRNFGHAAAAYDARAEFQHVQTRRVLDAAVMLLPERARIADIGCGTGYFAAAAKQARPEWNMIGIDIAPGMCAVAATRCAAIAGDAARLPLADASVDAAVSSLCYQWVEDHDAAFAELARVLRPGGRAILASLGEETLRELRASAASADASLALLPLRTLSETRARMERQGFIVSLADSRLDRRYYPSVSALLDSMRAIGAGHNFTASAPQRLSPKRWQALLREYERLRTPEGIPATWEQHFFVLHRSS
jgi:malonyl-CoA O-methyltransferase